MESVSVDRLRVHIDRFKSLVDLFGALNRFKMLPKNSIFVLTSVIREHKKIMDWEDPKYTVFLLVGFTSAILFIDAEYALSVPLFIVVVLMTKMWFYRSSGGFRKQLIEKDTDVDLAPYKPYAYIRVAVGDVKHIGSSNQFGGGHPCPQFTKITLIQPEVSLKTVEDSSTTSFEYSEHIIALVPMKHSLGKSIRPVSSGSAIGTGSGISQLLSNLNIIKSDAKKDGILQNVLDPWPRQQPSNSVDISYLYPILQTNISTDVKHRSSNEVDNSQGASSDDIPLNKSKFRQWAEIQGKIKFTFYGDSPEQSFVDSTLGSITVPLKDLLRDFDSVSSGGLQPEVSGWYPIKWNKNLLNNIKV